jgi:1,4-dihydroxy-6-naphthoate synthase
VSLSLAISPCPNDTFVFHAWIAGLLPGAPAVDVTFADVDVTNRATEAGRLDIAKVSYGALPWILDRYALLPAGGALGRGCGPLLLTRPDGRQPGNGRLDGAKVAVPGDRTTAYLLFRLWAADQETAAIEVVPFDQIMPGVRDGRFDAGLVIHEARFTYQRYGLGCLVDLGEWWEQETGLAIPLGAIVARRELDRELITEVIRSSLRHAWAAPQEPEQFVLGHAQEMEAQVVAAHIGLYVNEHTLDLGEDGWAAVRGLLTRAEAAGLVPPVPPQALRV